MTCTLPKMLYRFGSNFNFLLHGGRFFSSIIKTRNSMAIVMIIMKHAAFEVIKLLTDSVKMLLFQDYRQFTYSEMISNCLYRSNRISQDLDNIYTVMISLHLFLTALLISGYCDALTCNQTGKLS